MKIIFITWIVLFTLCNSCYSQTTSPELEETSNSKSTIKTRIPKELIGNVLYFEKYSEIGHEQAVQIIESDSYNRDGRLENIFEFNLVFRRKMNSQIEAVINNSHIENMVVLSSRDIKEDLNNEIRFILKSEFSEKDIVSGKLYNPEYYIYDQLTGISYETYPGLETFLASYKSFLWYADNRVKADTPQTAIDKYIDQNLPNERKPLMSPSTRRIILAVLGSVGIYILAYVVSY